MDNEERFHEDVCCCLITLDHYGEASADRDTRPIEEGGKKDEKR